MKYLYHKKTTFIVPLAKCQLNDPRQSVITLFTC